MPKGVTVTKKGYIRITSGEHRHKYQHRRMVEQMLQEVPHSVWGTVLPESVDIHHIDSNPAHNCPCNFLVLDRVIHVALSRAAILRHPYTGRFITRDEWTRTIGPEDDLPDWVKNEAA